MSGVLFGNLLLLPAVALYHNHENFCTTTDPVVFSNPALSRI
jgi:hypothetical protein